MGHVRRFLVMSGRDRGMKCRGNEWLMANSKTNSIPDKF